MVDKYLEDNLDYLKFNIKSDDGTVDENVTIQATLIEDSKECIDFFKEIYENDISDEMFNLFVVIALIQGVEFIRKNKKPIGDLVSESYAEMENENCGD